MKTAFITTRNPCACQWREGRYISTPPPTPAWGHTRVCGFSAEKAFKSGLVKRSWEFARMLLKRTERQRRKVREENMPHTVGVCASQERIRELKTCLRADGLSRKPLPSCLPPPPPLFLREIGDSRTKPHLQFPHAFEYCVNGTQKTLAIKENLKFLTSLEIYLHPQTPITKWKKSVD